MTKKLDETSIINELRGQSAFFRQPSSDLTQPDEHQTVRTEFRSEIRSDALPVKRRTKRYSFEFYDDQVMRLKQLRRQAEDRNENLTLSDMAREALDQYLNRTDFRSE